MDPNFLRDIKESRRMFDICESRVRELLNQISGICLGNAYVRNIEHQETLYDRYLDCVCGIDYEFCDSSTDKPIITLAWRAVKCKYSKYPLSGVYNAFSLRRKRNNETPEEYCELNKRINAINMNATYPEYTAQVHYDPLDNDSLLSLAVAKTTDIFEAHSKGYYRICDPKHKDKEVYMEDVSWKLMANNGYKIYDWYRDATCVPTTFLDVKGMEYINS